MQVQKKQDYNYNDNFRKNKIKSRRLTKTCAFACLPQNKSGQKNTFYIRRYAMPHEMSTNEVGQGEENDKMVEQRRCVQTEE